MLLMLPVVTATVLAVRCDVAGVAIVLSMAAGCDAQAVCWDAQLFAAMRLVRSLLMLSLAVASVATLVGDCDCDGHSVAGCLAAAVVAAATAVAAIAVAVTAPAEDLHNSSYIQWQPRQL